LDYARFGNWSEAISGLGTSAAVIVALAVFYRDRAKERDATAKREAEAETAVFQWLTSKEVRDEDDKLIGRLWDLTVHNSTDVPIYRWSVQLGDASHVCNYLKRPLLPGENIFNLPFLDNVDPGAVPEPVLIFEGSSGRVWTRYPRGTVEPVGGQRLGCPHTPKDSRALTDE
jgi:hypothetical protein